MYVPTISSLVIMDYKDQKQKKTSIFDLTVSIIV